MLVLNRLTGESKNVNNQVAKILIAKGTHEQVIIVPIVKEVKKTVKKVK